MHVDLEALEHAPPTRWSSVVLATACASVTLVAASLFIRIGPTEGYHAGYGAAIAKGAARIQAEVDVAGGAALRLCNELLSEATAAQAADYGDFIDGCGAGIDDLYGLHVPLLDAESTGNAAG